MTHWTRLTARRRDVLLAIHAADEETPTVVEIVDVLSNVYADPPSSKAIQDQLYRLADDGLVRRERRNEVHASLTDEGEETVQEMASAVVTLAEPSGVVRA